MRRLTLGIILVALAGVLPARAECIPAAAPDGRLAASMCAEHTPDGAAADVGLHLGAYDAAEHGSLGSRGLTVGDVPGLAREMQLGPDGFDLRDVELFGPTAIQTSLGAGGLTAGLTPDGTIAVLSWPNPSYFNQMDYLTAARGYPRMGAAENHGAFAGLDYVTAQGTREFVWLRDWPATQHYESATSDVVVTEFTNGAIHVVQRAAVSPHVDAMALRYEVSGVNDARIVFFENLNPNLYKIPWAPGQDQYLWQANDFAALWDGSGITHFRPATADPGSLLNVVEGASEHAQQTLAEDLAAISNPGVAFEITSSPRPDAHQIGQDAGGLVREGESNAPAGGADAYYDASRHGAVLSNTNAAAGQVDAAIAVPVADGVAEITLAAGSTAVQAQQVAAAATYDAVHTAAVDATESWLAPAKLPVSAANLDVDRRALIALRNATANSTGAIVASIARQTPYAEDWTRDGAFFNYALELAGHPEMVAQHNRFYARAQRANGTWGTMYYADGEEGGPFLYESDQTGLATWTLWQHYVFTRDGAYLNDVYPAIARAADWMTNYADPATGKQGPGSEDDNFFPSEGLQGATAVWTGLVSASRAAAVFGDVTSRDRWKGRAAALKAAILQQYFPGGVFTPGNAGYEQHFLYEGDFGAGAWALWPAGLLDRADPSERAMLQSLAAYLYDKLDDDMQHAPILSYQQKGLQALAVYLGMGLVLPGGRDAAKVAQWIDAYHRDLPTPTLHYGEQIWRTPDGWANRVDTPHVWSGVLVYLDAMALTRPALVPYRPWNG